MIMIILFIGLFLILCYELQKIYRLYNVNGFVSIGISVATSYIMVNACAFFLAIFGFFSINILIAMLVLIVLGCLTFEKNSIKSRLDHNKGLKIERYDVLALIIIVIFVIICMMHPVYYLWGRRDPSLYYLMGINISRNGSIIFPTNEVLNQAYNDISEFSDYSFRGIFPDYIYLDNVRNYSSVSVQFVHFFSAALAIGDALIGTEGLVRVPCVIGGISLLTFYSLLSMMMKKKDALISMILLALCPAQLWGAKITQTEECVQIFVFVGIIFFCFGLKCSGKFFWIIAGMTLGISNLIRIDSILIGLGAIIAVFFVKLFCCKEGKAEYFLYSYMATTIIATIVNLYTSYIYVSSHGAGAGMYLVLSVCMILVIGYIIVSIIKKRLKVEIMYKKFWDSEKINWGLIIFVIGLFVFKCLWYIRPQFQNGINASYDYWQRCFRELFFYIPIWFYVLFFIAFYCIIKYWKEKKMYLPILFIGLVTTIVYLYKPQIAPDHIWASRRWIVSVIPFIIIMAVTALDYICDKTRKIDAWNVRGIFLVFSILFFIDKDMLFINKTMLKDMEDDYIKLSDKMDDDKIYFVEMSHYGVYLRFLYNRNVVVLNLDREKEFKEYVESRDGVYYIGDIESLKYEYENTVLYEGEIAGEYISQTEYVYPDSLEDIKVSTNIYLLK